MGGQDRRYLAVWPWFPESYWSFRRAFVGTPHRAGIAPLPLLTVAGAAPADVAWRLHDENVSGRLRREGRAGIDAVVVSGMLVQRRSIDRILALCRAAGVRTVLGGPCVTQEVERFGGADYRLLGELEGIDPGFWQAIRERPPEGGHTFRAAPMPDVTRAPAPRFDLASGNAYMSQSIQFSRGCPFNCEFCDIIEIYGRKPRTKTNAQMLDELERLRRTGFQGSVFLVDDNFIGNIKAAERLLVDVERWQRDHGFPFSFYTEASVNLAEKPDLMRALVAAGFYAVFSGIESPDEDTLEHMQKRQNTARALRDSVRLIQESGLEIMGGFIVGFDGEDQGVFERQRQFIQDAAIPLAMVGTLHALPGTQLTRRLDREGRLDPVAAAAANEGDQFGVPNFATTMATEELVAGYSKLLDEIYDPEAYFERVVDLLRRLGRTGKARHHSRARARRPHAARLRGIIRILADMHRSAGTAKAFWKGLFRVLRERPNRVGKYIAFAGTYRHLAGYTREEVLPALARTLERLRLRPQKPRIDPAAAAAAEKRAIAEKAEKVEKREPVAA